METRQTPTIDRVEAEGTPLCGSSMATWLFLVRVHDKMQRHSQSHLEHFELTPAQYDVLAHLYDTPGITQQVLAAKLLVTKGNICGLIDRMSMRGLVERRCDPKDRRNNLLFLTGHGTQIAVEAVPDYAEFVRDHLSTLTPEEHSRLQSMLQKLDNSIQEH